MGYLSTVMCAECGVKFGVDSARHQRLVETGDNFYCPNGHVNIYRPSKHEKRIAELKTEVKRALARHSDADRERAMHYARFSDTLAALRTCPVRCGWRSRKRTPIWDGDDAFDRGLIRVQADVVDHLLSAHGVELPTSADELIEELAR